MSSASLPPTLIPDKYELLTPRQTTTTTTTDHNLGINRISSSELAAQQQQKQQKQKNQTESIQYIRDPIFIKQVRWYQFLVPEKENPFGHNPKYKRARALMEDHPLSAINRHLIVCHTPNTINNVPFINDKGEPRRLFAIFDSYLDFYQYRSLFAEEKRAFYEIVFGEFCQKPHFDIDIPREAVGDADLDSLGTSIRDYLLFACEKVLEQIGVPYNLATDFLIYSSHGIDKRSYHVVLTNMCHLDNKEAQAFYRKVIELLPENYDRFVDHAVYSPRQQFRILGCQKMNSFRPKIFHEVFDYRGMTIRHVYPEVVDNDRKDLIQLYESLLSFTPGLRCLPSLLPPVSESSILDLENLPDADINIVNKCLEMMKNKINEAPFSLLGIRGQQILLKRRHPSMCPVCSVIHNAENPFIFIIENRVYWNCRRASSHIVDGSSKSLLLGYLDNNENQIDEVDQIEPDCYIGGYLVGSDKPIDKPSDQPSIFNTTTTTTTATKENQTTIMRESDLPVKRVVDVQKAIKAANDDRQNLLTARVKIPKDYEFEPIQEEASTFSSLPIDWQKWNSFEQ